MTPGRCWHSPASGSFDDESDALVRLADALAGPRDYYEAYTQELYHTLNADRVIRELK